MSDNLKTIREALDGFIESDPRIDSAEYAEQARAALDALESELAQKTESGKYAYAIGQIESAVGIMGAPPLDETVAAVKALKQERDLLAARLAPADSPPGDKELRRSLDWYAMNTISQQEFIRLDPIIRAAEAHLRSQQPETEEQRAERLLGEWLAAKPRWTWEPLDQDEDSVGFTVRLYPQFSNMVLGVGPTRAAATLDALAKARDAEGGK